MRSNAVAGLAAIGLLSAVSHAVARPADTRMDPNIGAVCSQIMHIPRIDIADFQGCVSSLSASLAASGRSVDPTDADVCEGQGLIKHTAAMATCILNRENAEASDYDQSTNLIHTVAASDTDKESYFGTPPSVTARREQYACSQLGFEPASFEFRSCVGQLSSKLYDLDHPSGGD